MGYLHFFIYHYARHRERAMEVEAQTFKESLGREIAFDDQEVRQNDPMLVKMISNMFVKLPCDTFPRKSGEVKY